MTWRVWQSPERRFVSIGQFVQEAPGLPLRAELRRHSDGRMDVTFIDDALEITRAAAHTFAAFVWAQLVDPRLPRCDAVVCPVGSHTLVVVTGPGARTIVGRYFDLVEARS